MPTGVKNLIDEAYCEAIAAGEELTPAQFCDLLQVAVEEWEHHRQSYNDFVKLHNGKLIEELQRACDTEEDPGALEEAKAQTNKHTHTATIKASWYIHIMYDHLLSQTLRHGYSCL